ncbi:MAG: DUF3467 domain-containing protein [Acidobacteria bacterium]|nr:DUF3467 domain-containing protein [Acidobacteriota bacterium]
MAANKKKHMPGAGKRLAANKVTRQGERQTMKISRRLIQTLPENVPVIFSDGLVVTHTQNEFVLSFMQNRHPLALTTEDVVKVKEIESRCIVRIIVTPGQMQEIVEALNRNFATFIKNMMAARESMVEGDEE